ncbi:hypothetical protein [Silanimonas sp.]|jgi:hypothetical protein|uniref:hypothetical protein n=1 Tax=Silanimonas sp. TaxID=1929290 RepID=UPI0022C9CCDB|nr:hypothetical protein [Silanimonas sp.]MCZ8113805.1 hypothetical protein [Silanimonas sp.]
MTKETALAIFLAPIVGTFCWWLIFQPARWGYRYLYRRMPEGRLRRLLLKERGGSLVTIDPPRTPLG